MTRVLVIVPTYNEKENIEMFITAVLASSVYPDLLIVDDNSPDGTGEIAACIAASNNRVHILRRPDKNGLGQAYLEGMCWGLNRDYTKIVQMDADFSHDPTDIARLVKATENSDLALGSRYVRGGKIRNWAFWRRAISYGGSVYARGVLCLDIYDLTSGFKCWRADLLRSIDLNQLCASGYAFQIEMTWRSIKKQATVVEVPIVFTDRLYGTSKMNHHIVIEAALVVLKLRFT